MRGPPGFGEAAHDARGSLRKRVPSGSSFCLPSRDPHQARQRLRFAPGASAVAFWRERDGPVPVNPACKKVFRAASSVFCLRASNRRGEAEPPGRTVRPPFPASSRAGRLPQSPVCSPPALSGRPLRNRVRSWMETGVFSRSFRSPLFVFPVFCGAKKTVHGKGRL